MPINPDPMLSILEFLMKLAFIIMIPMMLFLVLFLFSYFILYQIIWKDIIKKSEEE